MKDVSVRFDPVKLDLFWEFVAERQAIWHRRSILGLPAPWTDDPVLRRERFTNVYRELDPGTKYAASSILEHQASRADKLFNLMLYRLIGRSTTHSMLGFQALDEFSAPKLSRSLREIRDAGIPPFTAAYMVSAYSSMGSTDKIENVSRLFALLHRDFPALFERVDRATMSSEVHALLQSSYGFGNFLAYQVLVDTLYPVSAYDGCGLLPFNHDDWASAGPGAQRGIKVLTGSVSSATNLGVMRWLRDHQSDEFERLELPFVYLRDAGNDPVPLTLANIQNCLCEFYKYVKIQDGTGRGRRKFVSASQPEGSRPAQQPLGLGQPSRPGG